MVSSQGDQMSGLVSLIKEMMKSMSLDDACRRLAFMNNPELIATAKAAIEEELKQILTLRDPPGLIQTPWSGWYLGEQPSDVFWPPLKNLLLADPDWDGDAVDSVDKASTKVLSVCANPFFSDFQARGLVVGYVQSGKTANFTAVISKAADAGYRFFIVLGGITNFLRWQTQTRLDKELIELNRERWIALTEANMDFSPPPSTNVNAFLTDKAKQKTLCVIKKNSFRLNKLLRWLSKANAGVLGSCPTMIIDDEADLASPNTAKEADERTAINRLLVRILATLPRVTYIGYTATPFANVLIDPRDPEDLYPRHFIIDLPKPKGYYGPESIFGREPLDQDNPEQDFDGLDMIRNIPDLELASLRPTGLPSVTVFQPAVTSSLHQAILYFWLATAARYSRGYRDSHSTMLVHTTAYATPQNALAAAIRDFCQTAMADIKSGVLEPELREIWESEKDRVSIPGLNRVSFEDLRPVIQEVLDKHKVVVENYTSDERLVYGDDPAVHLVVGGNVLSRGLTLKGLIVSYFVRNASAYDTLLQMGRWFGYRRGYADLPRIWMTQDLKGYFYDLATVEEEIRQDIKIYESDGKSPLDFSVRIRSHSALMVTAKLKMQHAIAVNISYEGQDPQTTIFRHKDKLWLDGNLAATKLLISDAITISGQPKLVWGSNYLFKDVPVAAILRFLSQYEMLGERMNRAAIMGYINDQNGGDVKSLEKWSIAIASRKHDTVGSIDLGFGFIPMINRARLSGLQGDANLKAIMSPTDIGIDLIEDKEMAKTLGHEKILGARRSILGHPGLILIYPISKNSTPLGAYVKTRVNLEAEQDMIGLAIHFPWTGKKTPQKYVTVDLSGVERDEDSQFVIEDENE